MPKFLNTANDISKARLHGQVRSCYTVDLLPRIDARLNLRTRCDISPNNLFAGCQPYALMTTDVIECGIDGANAVWGARHKRMQCNRHDARGFGTFTVKANCPWQAGALFQFNKIQWSEVGFERFKVKMAAYRAFAKQ